MLKQFLISKGLMAEPVAPKPTLKELLSKANLGGLKDTLKGALTKTPAVEAKTIEEKLAALRGTTVSSDDEITAEFFGETQEREVDLFEDDNESGELTIKLSFSKDGKVKLIED